MKTTESIASLKRNGSAIISAVVTMFCLASALGADTPATSSERAARLETARGLVEVRWHQTEHDLTVEAAVPAGVTGVIRLPGQPDRELVSGSQTITVPVHRRRKSGGLA